MKTGTSPEGDKIVGQSGKPENIDHNCIMEGDKECDIENNEISVADQQNSENIPQMDGIVNILPKEALKL